MNINQTLFDTCYRFKNEAAMNAGLYQVFTLDSNLEMLNTGFNEDGSIIFPTGWHASWNDTTRCGDTFMYMTRFPREYFLKLKYANIVGMAILTAGHPDDVPEQKIIDKDYQFQTKSYSTEDGSVILTPVDLTLTGTVSDLNGNESTYLLDERIAANDTTYAAYRKDWNGAKPFSNLGLLA